MEGEPPGEKGFYAGHAEQATACAAGSRCLFSRRMLFHAHHLGLGSGRALAAVALSLALGACASPIFVATDVDPEADFSLFGTYAWLRPDPLIPQVDGVRSGPLVSPIDDKRVRQAVDAELAARQWTKVDDVEQADLVVSYGIGAEEKTELYETGAGARFGRGYRYGGWYAGSTVSSRQYTEGTLALEFFDRRTKQAVWVGWASQRITTSDERQTVIEQAVEKILLEFPSRS